MQRLLLVVCAILAAGPAAAADLAGEILRLQGIAAASDGTKARQLTAGDRLFVGETVTTGAGSRLRLRLVEGAVITLGDNSSFTLVGYQEESNGPVLDFIRGVFRAVTSEAEAVGGGLTIDTPLGSLGVRGTTFWGGVSETELSVALIEGEGVWVRAGGRQVELTIEGGGVTVLPGGTPSEPRKWSEEKLAAARRSIAFD